MNTSTVKHLAAGGGGDEIQAVADDVNVHVQGDVAWVEGRGRFTTAGGGERPVRMIGVLVREDGQWKAVQSHASIGGRTTRSSVSTQPMAAGG